MDQFPIPFSPIQTTRPTSETSSPPSSRTTSPPSSPTSTFRRRSRTASRSLTSPHHLFNLSFQPHPQSSQHSSSSCEHAHAVSILPCAVLRGRSSLMVVRRRPSAVDMALSEERSRCDCDAIERAGLDLMEPRPVVMERETRMAMNMNVGAGMGVNMGASAASNGNGGNPIIPNEERRESILRPQQSPRFVMGGIFEVMEGRA